MVARFKSRQLLVLESLNAPSSTRNTTKITALSSRVNISLITGPIAKGTATHLSAHVGGVGGI